MTLEETLGIITVAEAIQIYLEKWPQDCLTKLQIEYEGPFLKYEFRGNDGQEQHAYEINAQNRVVIKEKTKSLSAKKSHPNYLERKKLHIDDLLSLTEINNIAKTAVPVNVAYQWELARKDNRTIWKVELASEDASQIYEVKIDAQEGLVMQTKLKN